MTDRNLCTLSITLRGPDVDTLGRWKPSAILQAMQEAAGYHCDALGLSYARTLEAGLFWVVTRVSYQLERIPVLGETLHIATWSGNINRLLCPRHYRFTDASGQCIGVATSQWILLDAVNRATATIDRLPAELPSDRSEPPLPMPKRIRMEHDLVAEEVRRVRFSECDTNRHLNNTHYADWFCDMLPDRLEQEAIAALQVNFKSELLCGQAATLRLYDGEACTLEGIREDGTTAFEIRAELTPWDSAPAITL